MTIREVNAGIFRTECGALLLDGLSCSQPVLSVGEYGLIDNFFVYSQNHNTETVSAPKIVFGIYSDTGAVAYINHSPKIEAQNYPNTYNYGKEELYSFIEKYEDLYSFVRTIAFKQCDAEQAKKLREYCELLSAISGSAIWGFYQKLIPSFFAWAKAQIQQNG